MKGFPIAPATINLRESRLVRRHVPSESELQKDYTVFRPCLRWEFDFVCAFCLCHEVDLASEGVEGSSRTSIEHFELRKRVPEKLTSYINCFYVCRRCNQDRGEWENVRGDGAMLINPCERAWADAFRLDGDNILPADDMDKNAGYTVEVYRINSDTKVFLRALRRGVIARNVEFLRKTRGREARLLSIALAFREVELIETARDIRRARRNALEDLIRFPALPADRDAKCRCDFTEHLSLSTSMEQQTVDLLELVAE